MDNLNLFGKKIYTLQHYFSQALLLALFGKMYGKTTKAPVLNHAFYFEAAVHVQERDSRRKQ